MSPPPNDEESFGSTDRVRYGILFRDVLLLETRCFIATHTTYFRRQRGPFHISVAKRALNSSLMKTVSPIVIERARPLAYGDSLWSCLLDDHIYEEEDGELAKVIGKEDADPKGPSIMDLFLFFAAPSVSEEEDPRTVRLPAEASNESQSTCYRDRDLNESMTRYYDFGETPPISWVEVPEGRNDDAPITFGNVRHSLGEHRDGKDLPVSNVVSGESRSTDRPGKQFDSFHSDSYNGSSNSTITTASSQPAALNGNKRDMAEAAAKTPQGLQWDTSLAVSGNRTTQKHVLRGRIASRERRSHEDEQGTLIGEECGKGKYLNRERILSENRRRSRSKTRIHGRGKIRRHTCNNAASRPRRLSRDRSTRRNIEVARQERQRPCIGLNQSGSVKNHVKVQIIGVADE
jgi:hypothetical protein